MELCVRWNVSSRRIAQKQKNLNDVEISSNIQLFLYNMCKQSDVIQLVLG